MSSSWRLDRETRVLGILTLIFAVMPYVIFVVERWVGQLPGEMAWLDLGWNHGPWRWQVEGFTLFYPLIILALVTILLTVWQGLRKRELRPVAHRAVILTAQILLVMLQGTTLFWLID